LKPFFLYLSEKEVMIEKQIIEVLGCKKAFLPKPPNQKHCIQEEHTSET
jgi:hypothetical protein